MTRRFTGWRFVTKNKNCIKETAQTLDRLLRDFPSSSWSDDAKVIKLEITNSFGKTYYAGADSALSNKLASEVYSSAIQNEKFKAGNSETISKFFENQDITGFYAPTGRTRLERENEIKIAAFQSLLSVDQKRGIEVLGEVLKSDFKTGEALKLKMLCALRSPRLLNEQTLNVFINGVSEQNIPLLREILMKSFQTESNIKIRKEIIYVLANINDEKTADYLAQLYASESDKELKKAVINSLGSEYAGFGFFTDGANKIFGTAISKAGNGNSAGANTTRKRETDKLLEIVRTEKDAGLRRLAFSALTRTGSSLSGEETINLLADLYDAETDENMKLSIIRALANSRQNHATRKLIDIAKNDKSDKLKIEAIYALRTVKNPEALKFLESIIK